MLLLLMIDMQDDGSEDSESDYNNYFEAGVCKISIKCCRKKYAFDLRARMLIT